MKTTLEVCCGDIKSVIAAQRGGANRVELCSALELGGLTPSFALIEQAVALARESDKQFAVNVLIRPRKGDFLYDEPEIKTMLADIHQCVRMGVDGVVIGALTPMGDIDSSVMRCLIEAAQGLSVTLHRAFDMTRNLSQSLEDAVALRCDRILTSGGFPSALEGSSRLRELVNQSAGRISIMAGAGINSSNVARIVATTGVKEVHASARFLVPSRMDFRNESAFMGSPSDDEYSFMQTSETEVRKIKNQLISQINDAH